MVFSESSLRYGPKEDVEGKVWHHAVISRDRGRTWKNVVVDSVHVGTPCVAEGCSSDFYIGQTSVASDPNGTWCSPTRAPAGPVVRSASTYAVRATVGAPGARGGRCPLRARTQPARGSPSPARARRALWYMQTSYGGNPNQWNVWFRRSANGGRTWSSPIRLSNAVDGPGYVRPGGFREIYGDYGEIAVTSDARTIAAWGEGFSYFGPGGTWFAIEN